MNEEQDKSPILLRVLLIASDLFLAIMTLLLVLRLLTGWSISWVALGSDFLHILLLPAFILLFPFVFTRRWLRAGISVALVIVWVARFGPTLLDRSSSGAECSDSCTDLTVMTYNVGHDLTDADALVALLNAIEADVVGLQELSPNQREVLQEQAVDAYPYQAFYFREEETSGLGLLSRYPIVDQEGVNPGLIIYDQLYRPYLRAGVEVDDISITIVVVRGKTPQFTLTPTTGPPFKTWPTSLALVDNPEIAPPAIILGDMNMTDQSKDYDAFRQAGYLDAWREVGKGFGFTYPARSDGWRRIPNIRLLRVDYILSTVELPPAEVQVVQPDVQGSDHYPVMARLVVTP